MDYFSIGLLLRTLFSLFRQDGAGSVNGPLSVKFQAFIGRVISRVLGAAIRSVVLVIGVITITLQAAFGLVFLLAWAVLPWAPIVGFVLAGADWMPWRS